MASIGSLLWVCTDCALALANDDTSGIPPDELADWEERFAAGIEREVGPDNYGYVVLGANCHSDDCDRGGDCDREGDCDCEHDTFSRVSCDLCRSHLAGERFAATVICSN